MPVCLMNSAPPQPAKGDTPQYTSWGLFFSFDPWLTSPGIGGRIDGKTSDWSVVMIRPVPAVLAVTVLTIAIASTGTAPPAHGAPSDPVSVADVVDLVRIQRDNLPIVRT